MIKAAERMRAVYKQMLAGKTADVRGAEEIHQEALREAKQAASSASSKKAAIRIADAVMMPVAETLDALPGEEPPGRLTKPLRRMGFNVLEGVPISAKAGPHTTESGAGEEDGAGERADRTGTARQRGRRARGWR